MPRNARKNIEGKHFHVMVQGIGKEYVFPDDESKGYYLSCLQKAREKHYAKIVAFCVMGNHAHILVVVESAKGLAEYFRRANADYAMYYNRRQKRVGYVFRDRFRSELITGEKYMANCVAYIQNNPVKAGMVERAEDYQWSSYVNYLTGRGITDFDEAAKYFDTSPENMREVMKERTWNWMEHDDMEHEDKFAVLQELIKKYKITSARSVQDSEDLLAKVATEIRERSGASLREIAQMLEVGREKLRRAVSTPPSP